MRDHCILYNENPKFKTLCMSCNNPGHSIRKCPLLNLNLSKDLICKRIMLEKSINRITINRKKKNKLNSKKEHKKIEKVINTFFKPKKKSSNFLLRKQFTQIKTHSFEHDSDLMKYGYLSFEESVLSPLKLSRNYFSDYFSKISPHMSNSKEKKNFENLTIISLEDNSHSTSSLSSKDKNIKGINQISSETPSKKYNFKEENAYYLLNKKQKTKHKISLKNFTPLNKVNFSPFRLVKTCEKYRKISSPITENFESKINKLNVFDFNKDEKKKSSLKKNSINNVIMINSIKKISAKKISINNKNNLHRNSSKRFSIKKNSNLDMNKKTSLKKNSLKKVSLKKNSSIINTNNVIILNLFLFF